MDGYKPKFAQHNKRDYTNDDNRSDVSSISSSDVASNFFKTHQKTISICAGIVIALVAILIIILIIYKFVLAPKKKNNSDTSSLDAGGRNSKNNPNQTCDHHQQQLQNNNKSNFVNKVDPKLQSALAKRDALLKQKELDIAKQNNEFYNERLNDIKNSQQDSSTIVDVDTPPQHSNNTVGQNIYDDSDNISELKIEDLPNDEPINNNEQSQSNQQNNDLF